MIINAEESQVELIGDIQEFKTGIDPKNLEFITTLLSSNLYSAPERSFIREIVSNAWDSHVEAGNTDTPVLVRLDTQKCTITIRDFGTGLSPERFQEVYCNIGSSTKRESNEFIGGFGIGKFASLAVSNTVKIVSYYNGKAYHYLMVKDGNRITNNLITTLDTTEKDGVEVTVSNITGFDKYIEALSYIVFFPNVYVDCNSTYRDVTFLNEAKIKHWKAFACASTSTSHKLLLGNVLYPMDMSILPYSSSTRRFLNRISGTGLVIKFNIGELEVTPNRENIIYSERVIALIKQRIEEAREEMITHIKSHYSPDYTDIFEWADAHRSALHYDFITDKIGAYVMYGFQVEASEVGTNLLYKGQDMSMWAGLVNRLRNYTIPSFRGVINDDKIYSNSNKLPYACHDFARCGYPKLFLVPKEQRLLAPIKEYLKNNYDTYCIIGEITPKEFLNFVIDEVLTITDKSQYLSSAVKAELKYIVQECYNKICDNVTTVDFNTDPAYLEFRDSLKATKTAGPVIKNFYIYVWYSPYPESPCPFTRKITKHISSFDEAVQYIRQVKRGVIINNISGEHDEKYASIANARGYYYITAAKPIVEALRDIQFSNVIDLTTFLNSDKVLTKLSLMNKLGLNYGLSPCVLSTIPEPIRSEIQSINDMWNKYSKWSYLVDHVSSMEVEDDEYLSDLADKVKQYRNKFDDVCVQYGLRSYSILEKELITAILVKTKAYRVSNGSYKVVKDSKIIQALWQK